MKTEIASLAGDAARRLGDRKAICFPGVRTLSFTELDRLSGQMAAGLSSRGVKRGDRVAIHLPNSWEWIVAYHAIARIGAVVVPANILFSPAEMSFALADSGARAIILSADRIATIDGLPELVIVPGGAEGAVAMEALLEGEPMPPLDVGPGDLFTIGYTSGTTGKPKGAMLSHANVFWSVAQTATIHVRHAGDRVYSALPFPHVYGNVVMNACLLTGAILFAPQRFDAGEALECIGREEITLFEGVPTMYYQMLAHRRVDWADFSSLTRCTVGGQTMPVAKLDAVAQRFGCPVLELWGMTEVAGPAASHSPWWPPRHGSIGKAFPGTELRIADADAPDTRGELMVRGSLVASGYWNNPEATAAMTDADGWLATGDIATIDTDGYAYIVDRKKDMILTAGYNVYPAELEQVIAMHEAVAMVAVVGVPDEEKGELAHAFVVLHRDRLLEEVELITHCRKHLASYKVPRLVSFVADLPKTSTGKILRRALREEAAVTPPVPIIRRRP